MTQLFIAEIDWARERTIHNDHNEKLNHSKSLLLQWAFQLAFVAFALNLPTLLSLFFSRPS